MAIIRREGKVGYLALFLEACRREFRLDFTGIPGEFRRIPWNSRGVYTDSGVFQCAKREGFSAFRPGGILCYIIVKNSQPTLPPAPSPGAAQTTAQTSSKILPWVGAAQECSKILHCTLPRLLFRDPPFHAPSPHFSMPNL